jgi:hypothetical protein
MRQIQTDENQHGYPVIAVYDKRGQCVTEYPHPTFHHDPYRFAAKFPLSWSELTPEQQRLPKKVRWCISFTQRMGATPSVFMRSLNRAMYVAWVEPYADLAREYAIVYSREYKRPVYSSNKVRKLHNTADLLWQAKADGVDNITPWIFLLEKDPKELREYFGKGLWKRLAHNSKTRNALIANQAGRFLDPDTIAKRIMRISQVPSTLLKCNRIPWGTRYAEGLGKIAVECAPTLKAASSRLQSVVWRTTVTDTLRMLDRLGRPLPNYKGWSDEDWFRLHDGLSIEVTRQGDPNYDKPHLDVKVPTINAAGFEVVHLASNMELAQEGAAMHHCVASYRDLCQNRTYIAFSIKQGGKRVATLGLTLRPGTPPHSPFGDMIRSVLRAEYDQCYGPCNKDVMGICDIVPIDLIKLVIRHVNGLMLVPIDARLARHDVPLLGRAF